MELINTNKSSTSDIIWEGILNPNKIIDADKQYIAIVDSNVKWFYKEYFKHIPNISYYLYSEPSEDNKTMEKVNDILNFLFNEKADRSSILLGIGGGVTLDVSGFVASIYKRGIDWVAIPTTLLSQVDASVGGKTAINHNTGKNAIGSFYPPKQVLISSIVSQSWKDWHYLEGIAEMYKIFKTFDHKAATELVQDPMNDYLIHKSISIKANVVRVDPWENHIRAALNYGHTIGHALELAMPERHGLSVALGIRCENYIAETTGVMTEDKRIQMDSDLDKLGFKIPDIMPRFERLVPYLLQDKKNIKGNIMLTLIDGTNEMAISKNEPREKVGLDEIETAYNLFINNNDIREV